MLAGAAALAAGAAAIAGWLLLGKGTPGHTPFQSRRVLLVVVDALRADAVGCYGYPRPTTPNLDALAEEGVLFERFHSASSWTLPSFGSILTGVSPSAHGAGRRTAGLGRNATSLREDVATLPERLPGAFTGAVLNNGFLTPAHGLHRGFGRYDNRPAGFRGNRSATKTTAAAISVLKAHADGPLFLVVHYFEPHTPYAPPEAFARRLGQGERGAIDVRSKDQFTEMYAGRHTPPPGERAYLRGQYDGEIAYADQQIGRLVRWMDRNGFLDDTWIAVTADHGEELWEHGSFEHGHRYEEEVTRVPLVLRAPGGEWHAGERVAATARHVDLLPTVLEIFAREPDPLLEGESLLGLVAAKERRDRPCYMEFHRRGRDQRALFDGRYKIIVPVDGGEGHFYDLAADPGERRRLDARDPRYAGLEAALRRYRTDRVRGSPDDDGEGVGPDLDPPVLDSLRSLGYVD